MGNTLQNGNRADLCKECKTLISKRAKKCTPPVHYTIDVSHLVLPESSWEGDGGMYSVRIRSQGPDYGFSKVIKKIIL